MYKAVQSSRLYEQTVKQIEESILKGELKPGDQLPAERDLAQQFGVSRTAVREAVKTLREKGLVESYSGRGTFITNGTSQAIKQSLDFMMRIGPRTKNLLLGTATPIQTEVHELWDLLAILNSGADFVLGKLFGPSSEVVF